MYDEQAIANDLNTMNANQFWVKPEFAEEVNKKDRIEIQSRNKSNILWKTTIVISINVPCSKKRHIVLFEFIRFY